MRLLLLWLTAVVCCPSDPTQPEELSFTGAHVTTLLKRVCPRQGQDTFRRFRHVTSDLIIEIQCEYTRPEASPIIRFTLVPHMSHIATVVLDGLEHVESMIHYGDEPWCTMVFNALLEVYDPEWRASIAAVMNDLGLRILFTSELDCFAMEYSRATLRGEMSQAGLRSRAVERCDLTFQPRERHRQLLAIMACDDCPKPCERPTTFPLPQIVFPR